MGAQTHKVNGAKQDGRSGAAREPRAPRARRAARGGAAGRARRGAARLALLLRPHALLEALPTRTCDFDRRVDRERALEAALRLVAAPLDALEVAAERGERGRLRVALDARGLQELRARREGRRERGGSG
jgi:hypothetical protein